MDNGEESTDSEIAERVVTLQVFHDVLLESLAMSAFSLYKNEVHTQKGLECRSVYILYMCSTN